jgi:type II secretory pathway pseudopilin PulG
MTRKILSLALVALLINLAGAPHAYAGAKEEKQARLVAKVKANIHRLGTGEASRVKVVLRDKTKVEGYVSAAGDETFTVTDPKTGAATAVAYPQVRGVQGNNLSTGAKIAIGVGAAAAIVLLILWKVVVDDDE